MPATRVDGFLAALALIWGTFLGEASHLAAEETPGRKVAAAAPADRTTLLVPVDSDAVASTPMGWFPDQAMGEFADPGWKAYMRIWKDHHQHPADVNVRRFLGLPLNESSTFDTKRGRTAPSWLGWKAGSYNEIETPHFTIYSHASDADAVNVAVDLERCYWTWTQMFFPLWEASDQVRAAMRELSSEESVSDYLRSHRSRITIRRKLKIVLFANAAEYAQTLSRDVPGIERSTGFYSDARKTMCLYADRVDDAATRRHELVHQLFREATRSELGRAMPGEQSGFWLVEGIAGYFESMNLVGFHATVGGWDSPRLQFSRYRILVNGDYQPLAELQSDGRLAAQQREDIARWYAHAITHTHRLMDGGPPSDRQWVFREIAKLYRIRDDFSDSQTPVSMSPDTDHTMREFLSVDDSHVVANPSTRDLEVLCLAGCRVTKTGIQSIGPKPRLTWLDLTRLPIGNDSLQSLLPNPTELQQLTLDATRVDSDLADWLAKATQLRELDLSWTPVDDRAVTAILSARQMSVLWMTGTAITDASIESILGFKALSSVDVQRTLITPAGVGKLREATAADVNPLELRTPQ